MCTEEVVKVFERFNGLPREVAGRFVVGWLLQSRLIRGH